MYVCNMVVDGELGSFTRSTTRDPVSILLGTPDISSEVLGGRGTVELRVFSLVMVAISMVLFCCGHGGIGILSLINVSVAKLGFTIGACMDCRFGGGGGSKLSSDFFCNLSSCLSCLSFKARRRK